MQTTFSKNKHSILKAVQIELHHGLNVKEIYIIKVKIFQ